MAQDTSITVTVDLGDGRDKEEVTGIQSAVLLLVKDDGTLRIATGKLTGKHLVSMMSALFPDDSDIVSIKLKLARVIWDMLKNEKGTEVKREELKTEEDTLKDQENPFEIFLQELAARERSGEE